MPVSREPSDCLIIIFGASGDLTKRKLIPSLFELCEKGQMPEHWAVMGVSRTKMDDEAFRARLLDFQREGGGIDEDKWRDFLSRVHYLPADSTKADDAAAIRDQACQLSRQHQIGDNLLLYLSLSPALYDATIENIGAAGMVTEGKAWCSLNRENRPWQRIIVEKPFGRDAASAAHLNRVLGRVFEEESIYRIDHYLGKETVQNLLVFRFANAIFEPIWNRNYIEHIQVTASETVGVEGRGAYYDSPSGGAMRDMLQSHLLQVMALIAMEPPVSMLADDIRTEKGKVLAAARPYRESDIAKVAVRGQYGAGQVEGRILPAYRDEEGVSAESQTDTYAALQVFVDSWRWEGVPFYLRSGKAMAKKKTEVVVMFKPTPHSVFRQAVRGPDGMPPNQIVINIQPDEGIRLRFQGKVPGLGMKMRPVVMDFNYVMQFRAEPPEAYSTLLLDAMRGDQTLFKNREETESAWNIVQPVLDDWATNEQDDLPNYTAGTWGPAAADIMMARDGRVWHNA